LGSDCNNAYPKSTARFRKLLARGLDPNGTNWIGRTFLHASAANGDQSMAAVFLKAGADLNARDLDRETPLATAVRTCFDGEDRERAERGRQMIAFLLAQGAATKLPGDEPWATPLAWARKRGLADVEEMLLTHGAS
jgi:ankyrin repeat protein